ncbi:ErfK/YbiS/YcfS/YnhG family protein [Candidatus Vecturithrix granuli]|uniref:ErfK/YbiS/YcfS/YnhG family protein n=1 Tax=Vecturithrix granuli TaxID=1499967 RepID=A0A081C1C1_VECG1|nr:ErfK/YbiS/YcfS/YnhG family protein [Candidatus Vecturithrix granuli]
MIMLMLCLLLSFGLLACSESETKIEPPAEPVIDISTSVQKLQEQFGLQEDQPAIIVSISAQKLLLVKNGDILARYPISSSEYGVGNKVGSNQTPLGAHKISHKIGDGAAVGAVFRSRAATGEMATIYTDDTDVEDDLVTTRILWLQGLEPGINQGKGIDSHARFIYIHGTPEEGLIGQPASHGCIRMYNQDVIELFNVVQVGTLVEIQE